MTLIRDFNDSLPAKNSQTGDQKFFQFLLNKFETFVVMII